MLSFQRLDVYRCAIMVSVSASISGRMPKGFSSLTEQLRRAALSVPLNIAEAAGRNTDADAGEALRHCARIGHGVRSAYRHLAGS
jgi:hypothetical protein